MNKTSFIFDDVCIPPDRQIGRHSHPQWELSAVIRSAGIRTIGNITEPMKEREVILVPPDIPHINRLFRRKFNCTPKSLRHNTIN